MKNWKAAHVWTLFAVWFVVLTIACLISGAVERGQQSIWPRPIDIFSTLQPCLSNVDEIARGGLPPRRWVQFRGRREGNPLFLFHDNYTVGKQNAPRHRTYALHRLYPADVPAGTPGKPFILWKELVDTDLLGHMRETVDVPLNAAPIPDMVVDCKGMLVEEDEILTPATRIAGGPEVREIFLQGERPLFVTAAIFHAGWLGLASCLLLLFFFRAGRAMKVALVEVDHAELPLGAPLTVAVTLQAKANLTLNRILLRLTCEEQITIGSGKHQTTKREVAFKDEQTLGENVTLGPDDEKRWGVRLTIPERAVPSLEVAAHQVRWKLEGYLDIQGLLDVSKTVRLKVLPVRMARPEGDA